MPRLAGFTAAEVIRKLRRAGFVFDRQAKGSHEIWWNPRTRARTTAPNHPGDLPEGTVRAIIHQAQLSIDEFLGTLIGRAVRVGYSDSADPWKGERHAVYGRRLTASLPIWYYGGGRVQSRGKGMRYR